MGRCPSNAINAIIWNKPKQKNFLEAQTLKSQGVGVNEISRRLNVSKPTIIAWFKKTEYLENRGWDKGERRTHTADEESRIVTLKKKRIDEKKFFLGTPHIRMDYSKQFPDDPLPSKWFFDEVVRAHGLQTHEPKKRKKGQNIVSRLLFPIKSIVKLGRIHQSFDFVGKKFIAGQRDPISIFSTSYYQWFELYQIRRVLAETAENALVSLDAWWRKYPLPDVGRADNGMTFRGTGRAVGRIGKFVIALLNQNIIPLFSAAYQSYTNPHVEGHNRTFTEKLWSKYHFQTTEEIDEQCVRFNSESQEFYEYNFKERLHDAGLRYLTGDTSLADTVGLRTATGKKVCFIRFVERWSEASNRVGIVVLNKFIKIPEAYVNQYLFVQLNLQTSTLHCYSEHDGVATEILQESFLYTV